MSKILLALDSGSQSSRALLFDTDGEVLAVGRKTHLPMKYPEPGAVEQDPEDIKQALYFSIRECLANWGKDSSEIVGAALTTQRSTVLPVAADGTPITDAVSWLDRRTAGVNSEPTGWIRKLLKVMGKNALIPRMLSKSMPRQWRERSPEVLTRMKWIAPIEAWLLHQLTGNMVMAPGGVVGAWPFDAKTRDWSRSGLLYKLLGFEPEWLPKIVPAGQQVGTINSETAKETGLPEGLAVYACGGDKQAEVLGAGRLSKEKGVAAVSLGTASSICIPWKKPVASRTYQWLTLGAAEPGAYCLEYMVFRGMWSARWFADELARDLKEKASREGTSAEALLCEEAALVPPGSDRLMVWPRWSPTLQYPMETGTAVGLRETHTRGHFFRALLEGIAFDLRRGLGVLEKATGSKVTTIYVGGGGSRSDVVVQILADVLGLPVMRPPSEELAARGAAIVAALGAGVYKTPQQATDAMVPKAPRFDPNPENAALYTGIFNNAFLPGLDISHKLSKKIIDAVGKI